MLLAVNLVSLRVMLHFWRHRHHLLVRNRSPLLALSQGLALLAGADAFICQAVMTTRGASPSGAGILITSYVSYGVMLFALPARALRVIIAADARLRQRWGFVLRDSFCAAYCCSQVILWLAIAVAVVVWTPAQARQYFQLGQLMWVVGAVQETSCT